MERYGRLRLGGRAVLAAVGVAGVLTATGCSWGRDAVRSTAATRSAAETAVDEATGSGSGVASGQAPGWATGSAQGDGAQRRPVTQPRDEARPADPACATKPRSPGWIARENRLRGDHGWRPDDEPRTVVKAYLGQVSAVCGQTVDLHVSGVAGPASVTAYRIGWYGGLGARRVWSADGLAVGRYGVSYSGPPMYLTEASWPTTLRFTITPDWTPGFYVLDVRGPGQTAGGEAVPFVVRDDAGPDGSGTAPLLFQAAVLTYQAYNGYDRYSMYEGPHDKSPAATDRSRVASFDRPYGGSGYMAPLLYDAPLATEIEKRGFDVDYTTDVDVDRRPTQVAAHRALVIGGHSEYWTRRMYDAAEYARDHGVNLAFFGANVVYWHARLESSAAGLDRRMAVWRRAEEDPLAVVDAAQATVQWRSAPLNRPESALVGADFGSFNTTGGGFRILDPGSWILAGTGLTAGQTLPGSLAGEFDTVRAEDHDTPPDIDVLAAAPVSLFGRPTMATMAYYTAPSGAGVFSAGTTYWPCQVTGDCSGYPVDPRTSRVLGVMTDNLLRSFAAGPAGLLHPSRRHLPPSAAALLTTAASAGDVAVRLR